MRDILRRTADPIDRVNGRWQNSFSPWYGFGRLDVAAAVQGAASRKTPEPVEPPKETPAKPPPKETPAKPPPKETPAKPPPKETPAKETPPKETPAKAPPGGHRVPGTVHFHFDLSGLTGGAGCNGAERAEIRLRVAPRCRRTARQLA